MTGDVVVLSVDGPVATITMKAGSGPPDAVGSAASSPWVPISKPLIAAVNGTCADEAGGIAGFSPARRGEERKSPAEPYFISRTGLPARKAAMSSTASR